VRFAIRFLWVEDLGVVPNLHLRSAAQVDAAVGVGDGLVFELKFDVAELFIGGGVRTGADIDEFAFLDAPMLREFSALLGDPGVTFLALEGGPDGASCVRTDEAPGLTVDPEALGAVALGGPSLRVLADARRVTVHDDAALAMADAMFRGAVMPWCSTWF